jgi:acetyl esterase
MQKFYLSKSSLAVINTLKTLKEKGLVEEIQNLSPKNARTEFSKIRSYFSYKRKIDVLIKKDFIIENIPVRYYRGKNKSKNEILPIMIYFHGGGWVLGNVDTHDQVCSILVNKGKYDLISVDYSLAPEATFPKAINESKKILKSISKNKYGLKINNNKIILCGDSAGGNIATVLADYNKNNLKANVIFQVLVYPATHMFSEYESKNKYEGLILNKKLMKWFESHYCPKNIRKKYINDPRLSPIKNKKMKGMPDTLIVLAECDPLYDEGLLYGKKLKENNIKVEIKVYNGLMHGFLTMGGVVKEVTSVISFINKTIDTYL